METCKFVAQYVFNRRKSCCTQKFMNCDLIFEALFTKPTTLISSLPNDNVFRL